MAERRPHKKELWYLRGRAQEQRTSTIVGVVLTVAVNAGVLLTASFSGLDIIDPPPPERGIEMELPADIAKFNPKKIQTNRQAVAEEPDRTKPVEYVKESKSPVEGKTPSQAPASTLGNTGDVATPEPPREEPINTRALFSNPDKNNSKDTLAQHVSRESSDKLEDGHPQGNVKNGNTDGMPNAHLEGRTALNGIPVPAYNVQESGTVVVEIQVNPAGVVVKARAGAEGTNTGNTKLWKAAEEAAFKTKFSLKQDAPELQKGTITYIFKYNQ